MRRLNDDNGTVTMEFVLVMPIMVFMIFCIFQLALVCMAKQLTHYAAFSAARTAIVYNPADFSQNGTFYENKGVVHEAACTVLAWLGQLPGGPSRMTIPGWGDIPGSGYIRQQVSIDSEASEILKDVPGVKVTVKFRYPLLIPVAGNILAYFQGGGDSNGAWTNVGLIPSDMPEKIGGRKIGDVPYFILSDTFIMARPWDTATFPTAGINPENEAKH